MTTIAYRDGIMAADSLVSAGGRFRRGTGVKIRRLKNGGLTAGVGNVPFVNRLFAWLESGEDTEPPHPTDYDHGGSILEVRPDGTLRVWSDGDGVEEITTPFFAMGSGEEFAYGAMATGASARQAVEIAIQFDVSSGGEVHVVPLKP